MSFNRLVILACVGVLLCVGLTTLCSFSVWSREDYFTRQLGWVWRGGLVALVAAIAGHRRLAGYRLPWLLYAAAMVLLVVVLVLGERTNGALRWVWGLQPSEFAKLALLLALADHCAKNQGHMHERLRGVYQPMLFIVPMCLLIFVEPDWGTAMLLASVAAGLLFIAGVRWQYLCIAGIVAVELLVIFLCQNEIRLHRFLAFIDPERYRDTYAFQNWRGILAFAHGFLSGTGIGQGRFTPGHVPEQHTDFILSLVGEEMGFRGCLLVLCALLGLVICGARIAWRAQDPFGQYLAAGITLLIGLQALVNVGVVTSSLPNKGLPLPLVSYGGSSLVCTLTCIGLLLGIEARTPLESRRQ